MIRMVPERKPRRRFKPDALIIKLEPAVIEDQERAAIKADISPPITKALQELRKERAVRKVRALFARRDDASDGRASVRDVVRRSVLDIDRDARELRGLLRLQLAKHADIASIERRLRNTRGIARVERIPVRWAAATKPDPFANRQWGLRATRWFDARPLPPTANVLIGILDTGVDTTHPDLSIKVKRYYHQNRTAEDIVGHGTHVAGIIAARVNNGMGITGMCKPQLHCWKIFSDEPDEDGEYYVDDVAYFKALDRARTAAMQVVNLSLGGFAESPTERTLIAKLVDTGCVVVAAMGNEHEDGNPIEYPAAYKGVIAVGATNQSNRRATFSNTGGHIALCAPGSAIISTLPVAPSDYRGPEEIEYAAWDGTSMAAPQVTAAAALVIAKNKKKDLSAAAVRAHLMATANKHLPQYGKRKKEYGAGLLDIDAALAKAVATGGKKKIG